MIKNTKHSHCQLVHGYLSGGLLCSGRILSEPMNSKHFVLAGETNRNHNPVTILNGSLEFRISAGIFVQFSHNFDRNFVHEGGNFILHQFVNDLPRLLQTVARIQKYSTEYCLNNVAEYLNQREPIR